jgi:hypothetical protein
MNDMTVTSINKLLNIAMIAVCVLAFKIKTKMQVKINLAEIEYIDIVRFSFILRSEPKIVKRICVVLNDMNINMLTISIFVSDKLIKFLTTKTAAIPKSRRPELITSHDINAVE